MSLYSGLLFLRVWAVREKFDFLAPFLQQAILTFHFLLNFFFFPVFHFLQQSICAVSRSHPPSHLSSSVIKPPSLIRGAFLLCNLIPAVTYLAFITQVSVSILFVLHKCVRLCVRAHQFVFPWIHSQALRLLVAVHQRSMGSLLLILTIRVSLIFICCVENVVKALLSLHTHTYKA